MKCVPGLSKGEGGREREQRLPSSRVVNMSIRCIKNGSSPIYQAPGRGGGRGADSNADLKALVGELKWLANHQASFFSRKTMEAGSLPGKGRAGWPG